MKRFMAFCMVLALVICLIPVPQADAASMTATVKGGWLRLREQPNTNSKTINSYYTGTQVTILGTSGNWYYVRVNGSTGYMMGSYLSINADSGSSNAPSGNLNITAYVTSANGLGVRMRSGPGTTYGVIGNYPVGTKVTILAKGTYWFQISINGQVGYMMSQYLTTSSSGSSGSTGGSSSTGSGYTAYVTSANGLSVNLRSGAGKNYAVIGSYSVGTQVTVLEYGKTWSYIRVGTRTGYMMSEFLTTTGVSSGGTTSTPSTSGSYTAYVTSTNGYGVRMRTGAGTSYRVIATLPVGTQVTVLQHNATWDYIRFGTTDGYMQNTFLTTLVPDGSASEAPPAGGYYATVYAAANSYPVKMRKGAGTNYDVITSVPQGVRVTVISVSGDWAYISYNGTTGYMMKTFLVADPTPTESPTESPTDTPTTTPQPTAITSVKITSTGNLAAPRPGDILTASVEPAGATASYKWYRGDGTEIGNGSQYKVTESDIGKALYCEATGLGSYTGTAKSVGTGVATPTDLQAK